MKNIDNTVFELKGKVYKAIEAFGGMEIRCTGCAFRNEPLHVCQSAPDCYIDNKHVWFVPVNYDE